MTVFETAVPASFVFMGAVGSVSVLRPRDTRWLHLLLACMCWMALTIFLLHGLCFITARSGIRLDQYFCAVDNLLGSPSFVLGRLLLAHPTLAALATWDYVGFIAVAFFVMMTSFVFVSVRHGYRALLAFLLANLVCGVMYGLLPASGPVFAFPGFPFQGLSAAPHVIHLAAAPNCFPSGHFTMALLGAALTWRWRWARPLGCLHVALMVLATLGLGQHYAVDLIAAVPNAWLALWASRKVVRL